MNHLIRFGRYTVRQHHLDPVCKRTAKKIADRTPLNPPPPPTWAQLWKGQA